MLSTPVKQGRQVGELIVFVGTIRPSEYESFRRRGLPMALLYDPKGPVRPPDAADFVEIAHVSFDGSEPLDTLQRWQKQYGIGALLVAVEFGVKHHATLTEMLGLAGPSSAAAELALDKAAMRRCFLEKIGPESTAAIGAIASEADLREFAEHHGYPFVLKPTNLYGSMFVSQVDDEARALATYQWMGPRIRRYLDQVGRQSEQVTIQAEALLSGSCHSIDCVIDRDGMVHGTPVVDVLVGRDIGWDDFHHFARLAPSRLLPAQEEKATQLAAEGCRALGLSGCVAHVEFILTSRGPRLLEIGARPGGNRIHMLQEVFGVDVMYAYYLGQRGVAFDLKPKHQRPMGIVSPFAMREGLFRRCIGLERITALPTYSTHAIKVLPGDRVGPARSGYLPPISIELVGSTVEAIECDVRAIASFKDLLEVDGK